MIFHRRSHTRGQANLGWLKSFHSFSFAEYHDPQFMGFGVLRVINEDFIAPEAGFPTHSHRNMEIITYMIEGTLEHKDTLGNSELLRAGEVQRMTAGQGVRHSEFNHRKDSPVHLLQIWIEPDQKELPPSYQQKSFTRALDEKKLTLLVSPTQEKESLKIHQDIKLYGFKSHEKISIAESLHPDRIYYLQIINGVPLVNDLQLAPGDALALEAEKSLKLSADQGCEFLLFDLPMISI